MIHLEHPILSSMSTHVASVMMAILGRCSYISRYIEDEHKDKGSKAPLRNPSGWQRRDAVITPTCTVRLLPFVCSTLLLYRLFIR